MQRLRSLVLSALAAFAAAGAALAQDPPSPPGGFATAVQHFAAGTALGPVTLVDGVVTELRSYFPVAPPPATGWPVVLLIHGGAGSHSIAPLRARGRLLAAAGYVCIAYDVRGEGATVVLNAPGFDDGEPAKLRDMVEIAARAGQLLPAGVTADPARLAISGESMGGRHCFRAAAWSGQPLPEPIAPYTHMPVIAAIAPRIAPLDPAADVFNAGLLNADVATSIWAFPATDPFRIDLLAEDYAAIAARYATDPLRHYLPRLATTTVPMLITNVWDDAKHRIATTRAALAALPPTLPVHTRWTTNGHASAANDAEQLANDDAIRRFFDHHVKGVPNGVATEPRHDSGYAPPTAARRLDPSSRWAHALAAQWPPSGTVVTTAFLRSTPGPGLTLAPPSAVEPGVVVANVLLDPTYDVGGFCRDGARPAQVLTRIALDDEAFTGGALGSDLEILGAPRVQATVDCDAGDFHLTASLYAVAPNGADALITAGTVAVLGGAPGTSALSIELDDTAFVVPAGFRLRLVLRNLSVDDFPGNAHIRFVPCFVPSNTTVRIDPATPARLDLPTRPRPHAFVAPRLQSVSAAAGALATFDVRGGGARAGQFYLVLLSASGFSPGASFPPEVLPLNPDVWTSIAAAAPTGPFFPGFSGLLDATGSATATVDLRGVPIPPFVLGMRWTLAVLGHDGQGFWGGGPAEFEIVP